MCQDEKPRVDTEKTTAFRKAVELAGAYSELGTPDRPSGYDISLQLLQHVDSLERRWKMRELEIEQEKNLGTESK